MTKPYLIYVDGKLWERKLTKNGAMKVITELNQKWMENGSRARATLAYECITGSHDIINDNGGH